MKGAPPLVALLFTLCPICVIAMPILTVFVLIKQMAKSKDQPTQTLTDEDIIGPGS